MDPNTSAVSFLLFVLRAVLTLSFWILWLEDWAALAWARPAFRGGEPFCSTNGHGRRYGDRENAPAGQSPR